MLVFDSRGEMLTSEGFRGCAGEAAGWRDAAGDVAAWGPADGWSKEALGRASRVVSLGRMTLPHELARVVVAEQVYRGR